MKIVNVNSSYQWEKILSSLEGVSFLQSWRWGQFQKQLGNQVNRLQVALDADNFGAAQYYIVKSKIAAFLYCPRGPFATSPKAAEVLLDLLIKKAKEESVTFMQIEPDNLNSPFLSIMDKNGFIHQTSIQPQFSSLISLKVANEEIYANIRKTTRSLIRKAKEEKVIVKSYHNLSRWNDFSKLFLETTARQKFISHSLSYIKTQFSSFPRQAKLYMAEAEGKILAAAIVLSYRKNSTYLHAASSKEGRNLGASHLMVWTAIEDVKKKGDESFDMWGIAPPNELNHPWLGITTFKQGFGGQTVSYPGAFILPLQQFQYNVMRFANHLRAIPSFKMIQRILLETISRG